MKLKHLILLLLPLFLFQNCDIQKKRYSRGYTTNRIKLYKDNSSGEMSQSKKDETTQIDIPKDSPKTTNLEIEIKHNTVTYVKIEDEKLTSSTCFSKEIIQDPTSEQKSTKIQEKLYHFENTIRPNKVIVDEETNLNIFSILAITSVLILVILILLSNPFLQILLAFSLTYLFGFIAKVQIKKNPKKYSQQSNTLAIIALGLMYLSFLVSLIISFVVLIFPLFIAAAASGFLVPLTILVLILFLILALILLIGPLILKLTNTST